VAMQKKAWMIFFFFFKGFVLGGNVQTNHHLLIHGPNSHVTLELIK
jgi:hypothetical protein